MNHIVKFSEAQDEAKHLTRVLRRDVEVRATDCDCDYSKLCLRCAGSGTYYELIFSFCGHLVKDDEEDECDLNFCREQERVRAEMEASETLSRVAAPIKSCFEVSSEREADAA